MADSDGKISLADSLAHVGRGEPVRQLSQTEGLSSFI